MSKDLSEFELYEYLKKIVTHYRNIDVYEHMYTCGVTKLFTGFKKFSNKLLNIGFSGIRISGGKVNLVCLNL